ncbi:hypothetical protein [uncultured Alistipes sp.]|uniref:phage major capsid protein n=1 Tax=uncultured Alistipes sp. TaxID=538949 RepID=UPI002595E85E|nr:hypothetical protein [uncultured Alistipes sp.]
MKPITKIFSCLLMMLVGIGVNSAMGATVSSMVGGTPAVGALVANGVAIVAGSFIPANVLPAGVLTEIWTGELIKAFRTAPEQLGWYDRIRSYDQYVENDVIHFTEIGGDPKVLVNNSTYPLNITKLEDADKPVSLDKFDTEATPVTDDELHAVSYDKMASVQERHREAIKESVRQKAIHAIAPDAHSAGKTIVVRTSGEKDTASLRKRLSVADLIGLKAAFDAMGTPATDRVLVLCSEHVNDLLHTDQKFREAYNINQTEGKIARLYGFDIYEYNGTPYYTSAGNKKAFGSSVGNTDRQASVAFHVPSMMKANGSVQMYYSEAKNDPLYHRNLVNFRKWGICLPLKGDKTRAAIVSTVETA